MNISDAELRSLVRESIARHLPGAERGSDPEPTSPSLHPSHVRLTLASGDTDGACLIEPTVRCNHCGYCLSYGH